MVEDVWGATTVRQIYWTSADGARRARGGRGELCVPLDGLQYLTLNYFHQFVPKKGKT